MSLIKDWHTTQEAKPFINALLKGRNRRSFGLLDAPPVNASEVKSFRVWFRSGPMPCGKSATIARLAGATIHTETRPTMGAAVTLVFWPGKCAVTGRVILFKLELWEAGTGITGRFEHLEEMDEPDCVVAIFSIMDRNSFDSLPDLLTQINSEVQQQQQEKEQNQPLLLMMATHADRFMASEVPENEMRTFAQRNNLNLFRTENVNVQVRNDNTIDGAASIKDTGELLFSICDLLMKREQLKQAVITV